MTYAIGERLKEEGYRGYFELDCLIDEDTASVYLGRAQSPGHGRQLDHL